MLEGENISNGDESEGDDECNGEDFDEFVAAVPEQYSRGDTEDDGPDFFVACGWIDETDTIVVDERFTGECECLNLLSAWSQFLQFGFDSLQHVQLFGVGGRAGQRIGFGCGCLPCGPLLNFFGGGAVDCCGIVAGERDGE